MDLKPVDPRAVESAVRAQIAKYRVAHVIAGHVRDWLQGLGERKPNERLIAPLRMTVEAQFRGSYVYLTQEKSTYLKSIGLFRFNLEVGGFGDVMRFTIQCPDSGGRPDIEFAMTSHCLYEDFARALEDRIPEITEMAADFNAAIKVLKSVAQRCKARPGLDVQRGATYSPLAPLSDFFHGYEFI